MNSSRLAAAGLALAACLSSTARADLVGDVNTLQVWTRRPGSYSDDENPVRKGVVSLDPFRLKSGLTVKSLKDVQYDRKVSYRGVPLAAVVKASKPEENADLVLLHFENEMIVPIPIAKLKRLNAFLAFEACSERGRECKSEFEEVPRSAVYGDSPDPRPIQFSWNKIVVGDRWHPDIANNEQNEFSPWLYVDSLRGIEFVNSAAYYRQFAIGKSGGDEVFRARCQFCHAVRFVGAHFGWDFVTPLPIAEKRTPATLTLHVKYRKAMAPKLGIRMPPQNDVELEEMTRLWKWMRDMSRVPAAAYKP